MEISRRPEVRCDARIVGSGPFVVTFSNWHPIGRPHQAFGAGFLEKLGVNAAHVISGRSDWYTGDPAAYAEAFEAIRNLDAYQSATRRIGYGSSMGGYGAIRFRKALEVDAVVAFCPQFSVDPSVVPFETRWMAERAQCNLANERLDPITDGECVYLIYDPSVDSDRRHIDLIDPVLAATRLAIPFSGHPPMPFLSEIGCLTPMVRAALVGEPIAGHVREAFSARRQSSSFWRRLADYWLMKSGLEDRLMLAIWALGRAAHLKPEDRDIEQSIVRLRAAHEAKRGVVSRP